MEQATAYGHAILSMAGFALIALVLNPIAAAAKSKEGVTAGGSPNPDYGSRTYRLWRAHMNATEMMGVFAAVTLSAILAGASPFWVNLFASLFFVSRLVHACVHIRGIGAETGGPRTVVFVFGWAMCILLALMAVAAVLF